ncbi:hypothetical protein O5D80_001320 [Batrachochytrium dendrobatidis]|nr:hypothetical protein O5D80_001320 [Batrachochytrium dendrobatidis]
MDINIVQNRLVKRHYNLLNQNSKMKLAVAVLSSILLVCSVTIANPVKPSESTDTEASISTFIPTATTYVEARTFPTPNPNGIGLGGLNTLPSSIKDLLKEYEKTKHDRIEQKKICDSLRFQYEDQKKLVKDLKKKIKALKHKSRGNSGGSEYDGEIQESESNFEAQKAKLANLKKSRKECESKYRGIVSELELISIKLVVLVFGSWDLRSFNQRFFLIITHSSVKGYLGELASKGQSSGRNKSLGQTPSGDQQHQDPQPSSSRPSGSLGQRVPSNRRNVFSRLVGNAGSLFQRPGDEDREPLI